MEANSESWKLTISTSSPGASSRSDRLGYRRVSIGSDLRLRHDTKSPRDRGDAANAVISNTRRRSVNRPTRPRRRSQRRYQQHTAPLGTIREGTGTRRGRDGDETGGDKTGGDGDETGGDGDETGTRRGRDGDETGTRVKCYNEKTDSKVLQ
uniref:Uncharacterized protein n=1 Tax=Knipowitschia caucasica TaxID=637954 RepID=A0AAV2JMD4_KNICA